MQPLATRDIDVFVFLEPAPGSLRVSLDPLYARLAELGFGDFDPARPGVELAAIGKRDPSGGLIVWNKEGMPAWRKENTGGWGTWGDWNGDGHPEILLCHKTAEPGNGFQVWTGDGRCLYAIDGIGAVPLDIETASRIRPDLDGNGKAAVLVLDDEAGRFGRNSHEFGHLPCRWRAVGRPGRLSRCG